MVRIPQKFRDSNYEPVPYDGSEVTWRVSVYGLVVTEQKLLLIKHRDEQFYDIPGGGVDLDESFEEALLREGKEEAGWELELGQPLFVLSDWFYHAEEKRFYKSLQNYYLATGKKTLEKPLDPRMEWVDLVPLNELGSYKIYPNVLRAVETAQRKRLLSD